MKLCLESSLDVHFLKSDQDYDAVLDVLLHLRPSYNAETLSAQIKKQQSKGYRVVYVKSASTILAVAGFYIGEKLAWGKHIYIDDLVTNPQHRSTGVGRFLMAWLKQHAAENNCTQLHLDSGVQRFQAHKFYLREGFHIASHHFSLNDI
jgi:GNAT superfamily N-acetyltransferase